MDRMDRMNLNNKPPHNNKPKQKKTKNKRRIKRVVV